MNKKTLLASLSLATAMFALPALAEPAEWTIDPAHSKIGFTVPHLVVSEVDGAFKKWSGKAMLDDADLTKSTVEFTAETASIDTNEAKRDEHLKSPDFFDAAKNPQITFKSTKITKAGKGYKLTGDLTMHGVTKSVTLDATITAPMKHPMGKTVRAAKITGKVKRTDFGLNWNKALETGGVLVGEEVKLDIKLELLK